MIIWRGRGDLLAQRDFTQLCPITAMGAMGRGLAKTMRDAHPGLWVEYEQVYSPWHGVCGNLDERARILTHVELPTGKVLLFCSKRHWREASPQALVEDNLVQLAERWASLGIERLAMPLPGTGLGGLSTGLVEALVHQHLGGEHPLPIRLYMGT